jgi:hypothetical protein
VRRLIQVDFKTYLWQFIPALSASLVMVIVILGLKYLLRDQSLNRYLELSLYLSSGVLAFTLVLGLTARKLFLQLLELPSLVIPRWKFGKLPASKEENILK